MERSTKFTGEIVNVIKFGYTFMNQYNLTISEHNKQAHTDIEHDIEKQKDGLFTFILRVDKGNIVDYNVVEYTDIAKYLVLRSVIIQQVTIINGQPSIKGTA